jgi:hypothetical protein
MLFFWVVTSSGLHLQNHTTLQPRIISTSSLPSEPQIPLLKCQLQYSNKIRDSLTTHVTVSNKIIIIMNGATAQSRALASLTGFVTGFHARRVLLHAVNLRHGTDSFTSPPKEGVLRILSPLKPIVLGRV